MLLPELLCAGICYYCKYNLIYDSYFHNLVL